jgi:CRISPR-associated protein Cmr1
MVKPLMDKPPQIEKKETGRVNMTRKYELITPLFGGGVKANEVDVDNPIRGTAVRGHLRFWWRATQGGQFGEDGLAAMKAREDEIWGSTDGVSKIAIIVTEAIPGKPYVVRNGNVGDPNSPLGYVAFPLRDSGGQVYEGVSFTLQIECPKEYRRDLKAALWAWETFGGIGARTRRGFGALHCTDVHVQIDGKKFKNNNWVWNYASKTGYEAMLADMKEMVLAGSVPDGVASLSADPQHLHLTPDQSDAELSWKELIDSLRDFRQSRKPKTISGRQRPFGRSHWPEPDAIRDLTRQSHKGKNHDQPVHNPPIHKFPRAAFGLPIVFEFKDDDDRKPLNRDADPLKTELKGKDYERRASRLILRPLKCPDGRYRGIALILTGDIVPPGGLELKNSPKNPARGTEKLTSGEASQIQKLHPTYNGKTDILQAFLDQLP